MSDLLDVKIYTTSTCTYCDAAKRYFTSNDIEYEERNVQTDLDARAEFQALTDVMAVPLIVINGERFMGFKRDEIEDAIGDLVRE